MSSREYDPEKFQVELPGAEPLAKGAIVEHADHGPLRVDRVIVDPHGKRVEFWSEMGDGPQEGISMRDDEIREAWGETMAYDPAQIHEENPRVSLSGITAGHESIEVDIEVRGGSGDEKEIETVAVHARDEAVRAIQALVTGELPEDCEGSPAHVDWPAIVLSDKE